ncbi:helix-turn-helix domain-containing protein, partial [Vibrio parahaemolyticus]
EEGALGLKRINKPLHRSKNSIPEETEHKIIELTLNNPYQTSVQLRTMLKKEYNITVSSCTIRNIWKREALNTRSLRIQRSAALNKEV